MSHSLSSGIESRQVAFKSSAKFSRSKIESNFAPPFSLSKQLHPVVRDGYEWVLLHFKCKKYDAHFMRLSYFFLLMAEMKK